jgi:hypothetical protein
MINAHVALGKNIKNVTVIFRIISSTTQARQLSFHGSFRRFVGMVPPRAGDKPRMQIKIRRWADLLLMTEKFNCRSNQKGALVAATYFREINLTIIGLDVFHFRVRNGIGWNNASITATEAPFCYVVC